MSAPRTGPSVAAPQRRVRFTSTVVTVVAVLVLAVIGIGVAVGVVVSSGGGHPSVAELETQLDRVPVPPGAVLVDQVKTSGQGDRQTYVERRYRLAGTAPGDQIRALLASAQFRIVDPQTAAVEPVASAGTLWSQNASARSGDVTVLPPQGRSGGIEVQWDGPTLVLSLSEGDLGS